MKSYIAHYKCSGAVYGGGRTACLHWAFEHVKQSPRSVVNILIVRHKAPARIIAEVAAEGGFWVFGGRTVSSGQLSKLRRRATNGDV